MLLYKLYKRWRRRLAIAAAAAAEARPSGPQPTGRPLPKLFAASLKMLVRDRRTVIWSLAVPILFAVIFGVQDFKGPQHVNVIAVPPAHATAFGRQVAAGLRRDSVLRVTAVSDLAAAQKKLRDGKTDVVVAVPAARGGPLVAYYKPGLSNQSFALGSIQRFVDSADLRLAGVASPPLRLAVRAIAANDTTYYDYLLPGLVAMAVMNLSIIGVAIGVTRFREQQILKRILATPLRPGLFLLAQVSSRLLLSLAQAVIILTVGVAFGATIHGDPFWLFVFVVLGNIVFLNIGFAVAGRAKTTDSAQALAQLVTLPMLFLSGVFFPTSGALGQIVRVLPLSPLVTGLRKILQDGDSITQCLPQLGALAIWVVISFLMARRSFRFGDAGGRSGEPRLALRSLLRPNA